MILNLSSKNYTMKQAFNLRGLIQATEERFKTLDIDVPKVIDKIQARGILVNSSQMIRERFDYLGWPQPDLEDFIPERILGSNDFLPVNFFQHGVKVSRTVGRILVKDRENGLELGHGTGFLVGPTLMLTNHHVLSSKDEAAYSRFELNFEKDLDGTTKPSYQFRLDPEKVFVTSDPEKLDYTLVSVIPIDVKGKKNLLDFGYVKLIEDVGKVIVGERLTIIQHPEGGPKQVALRDNKLLDKDSTYLRYTTDTAPGSSGSMVLNDQWEVVALHHSGVPKRNNDGEILKRDGKVWNDDTDSESDIDWVANEGIRISRIVKDIESQAPGLLG